MDGEYMGQSPSGENSIAHASTDADRAAASALSTDDIFHLLQNDRRRAVLRYLRDADGPVELRDLAERIAASEHDTTVEALTSQQRQRVYISLYQTHLPKLDECGAVHYRKDRGVVVRRPAAAQLDAHLDLVDGDGYGGAWPRRYAGMVLFCTAALGASASGVLSVSGTAVATALLVAVGFVTAAHSWSVGQVPFADRHTDR